MSEALTKFQDLLRELFQFDCSDLDFGIYRIMNHKRGVVERFITRDLPRAIGEEMDRDALAEQSQAARELAEVAAQITATLGDDALDADGVLIKHHETKLGKKYLDLHARAGAGNAHSREAIEASIYNHLFAFFSRYYQDGDFISKRRYGKRERYAIPYNGEEVTLYWANHDQYYVKTGEYFTDYAFSAPNGVTVHFKLRAADVEHNNIKGEKRFFVPSPADLTWDEATRQLIIPFEFRPLTAQESIAFGQKNQQGAILAKALADIPKALSPKTAAPALAALSAEARQTRDGEPVSLLEHHLRQYTRRNTSDFFIHKDLKGFLSRELDFYLKNEVLNLDEVEAGGEARAEGWFQILRAIRAAGGRIIEFLAQIEDFQKMLWEKRKFVTEAFYCIALGVVPPDFYAEIAACDAQWEEWQVLFHIHEAQADLFTANRDQTARRQAFLQAHPSLVLDTRHFDAAFVDRLLAAFDDLDEMTDGLLVHSENWQGLNVLGEMYRERVKCIYIDPPYNTGGDGFLYRDSYQYSCWVEMMNDRLYYGSDLLSPESLHLVSIGEDEFDHLATLLSQVFSQRPIPFVWKSRAKPTNAGNAVYQPQVVAEFVLANVGSKVEFYPLHSGEERTYPHQDKLGVYRTTTILTSNRGRYKRETMRFMIAGYSPPPDKRWKAGEEEIRGLYESNRIGFGDDGEPYKKIYQEDEQESHVPLWTYLPEEMTGTAESGKADLSTLQGKEHGFDSVKPKELIQLFLSAVARAGVVADFFAGSGTTAHATIDANREDGGQRKFILVEMADYFDTVLLPRIKKVTFTPEWKDGQPKRQATAEEAERGPRIVKVIRLESYEDALNNIAFDVGDGAQQAMQFDDYLLRYMLKWEARASETLLNVDKLDRPFDYALHIHRDGQTHAQRVDLPETFAYLLGLRVQSRRTLPSPGGRGIGVGGRYLIHRGVTRDGRAVVVIWRDTAGWTAADYERDKQFAAEHKLAEGADEVLVNGDSLILGASSLEPIFKTRMFAPVDQ